MSDKNKITRTKKINPLFGLLGMFGFLGFMGFWTYKTSGLVFPFIFFAFFGFFGFYYAGKMSDTLMDERFYENQAKAEKKANKITFIMIWLALLITGNYLAQFNIEYAFIALLILVSLAFALGFFMSQYLLYKYDHESFDDCEE
ncbi:MAG: DUF3796 domain-containing protein [Butyrivibrio sp.]|nr:DUF3796 domain-containing protein [Butyrivibrio sp.]